MTTGIFTHERENFTTTALLYHHSPRFRHFVEQSETYATFLRKVENYCLALIEENKEAYEYYTGRAVPDAQKMYRLRWCDPAAIRLLDYIANAGLALEDPNTHKHIVSDPLRLLWMAMKEQHPLHPDMLDDFYHLFRQLENRNMITPASSGKIEEWTDRHPTGLDPEVIRLRNRNRDRILSIIIRKIEQGQRRDKKYTIPSGLREEEKMALARTWWDQRLFHLRFAVRNVADLHEMLDYSLCEETLDILKKAERKGIPFFVNPYYLSLINVHAEEELRGADQALRAYVFYSQELVNEFGRIRAWEKEDVVVPGKPNAAGWLLPPGHNLHRRYPEVAILIPDSMGRACGGLCASCQRMYDFQAGHLNFNLDKLAPRKKWSEKLYELLDYFRKDKQLRDILITGGDAFMSSNRTLKQILDAVYDVAKAKMEDNHHRPDGSKYAEMVRIRLGTRLPAYLPQRIDDELVTLLKRFRQKAEKIGFKQFFIQVHFESAMEITPSAKAAIEKLRTSGWIIINQMVFTAQASHRGHAAKLRQTLNNIGIITYYTFSVKGFMENKHSFATNARLVQEMIEEKHAGFLSPEEMKKWIEKCEDSNTLWNALDTLRKNERKPFIASDRSIMNLPGIGKSLSFRTIGLTPDGRRILLFDHDQSRNHSPIIRKTGKITIVENKSVSAYLRQMKRYGEDLREYRNLYFYSLGFTEKRNLLFSYPSYPFNITRAYNHLEV